MQKRHEAKRNGSCPEIQEHATTSSGWEYCTLRKMAAKLLTLSLQKIGTCDRDSPDGQRRSHPPRFRAAGRSRGPIFNRDRALRRPDGRTVRCRKAPAHSHPHRLAALGAKESSGQAEAADDSHGFARRLLRAPCWRRRAANHRGGSHPPTGGPQPVAESPSTLTVTEMRHTRPRSRPADAACRTPKNHFGGPIERRLSDPGQRRRPRLAGSPRRPCRESVAGNAGRSSTCRGRTGSGAQYSRAARRLGAGAGRGHGRPVAR